MLVRKTGGWRLIPRFGGVAPDEDRNVNKERLQNPKLGRLSWVAAALSLIVAVVTWIVPEPLGHSDFALRPLQHGEDMVSARPLIVLVLIAFAFTAFAFGSAAKGETFRFHLEFRGDWTSMVVVMNGLFILWMLAVGIIAGALALNSLTAVFVAALLGSAALMTLSVFTRRYRGSAAHRHRRWPSSHIAL